MALVDYFKDSDTVAQIFEREMRGAAERLLDERRRFDDIFMPKGWRITYEAEQKLAEVCATHFPRVTRALALLERAQEGIARARYALGVAIIGYDPAPPEDD